MSKTVFVNADKSQGRPGTIITAEFLNALNNQRHNGLNQDGAGVLDYAEDTGAANSYIISLTPALAAYITGMPIWFKASNANTGAATLNINNLGEKSIKKLDTQPLAAGEILAGQILCVAYDGTNFQLLSRGPSQHSDVIVNDVENAITGTGQTLSDADPQQLSKAIAIYAAGGDFYTDSGAADAYVLAPIGSKQTPIALFIGMRVRFIAAHSNTSASTVAVNGLTATAIKRADGNTALFAGDITAAYEHTLVYDGTNFRLCLSEAPQSRVHVFTESGTWVVPLGITVVHVQLVGGGGGGGNVSNVGGGGGGGGGGIVVQHDVVVSPGSVTVTIGEGGDSGINGGDSIFGAVTAQGGQSGGAGVQNWEVGGAGGAGGNGGSGGGGGGGGTIYANYPAGAGGSGGVGCSGISGGAGSGGSAGAGGSGGNGIFTTISQGEFIGFVNSGNGGAAQTSGGSPWAGYAGGGGGGGGYNIIGLMGVGGNGGSGATAAGDGQTPGGGGGGCSGKIQGNGGKGGDGICVIMW
ncbi:MAG: hypothetical protein NTX59_08190 [Elusimicrobia bacterium]|nr:hypothetical protein [Elusimicrobiota bacterium]